MSWLNGELILNGMSKKDLAYAHDYIRSSVRNNGDTREFSNLGDEQRPIKKMSERIFDCYEDADSYLDTFNWERKYNPIVAFRDVDLKNIKKTKKIENLELRKEKENEKLLEYYRKTDVKNFKAKLITCPKCESKINKDYINNCICPLCKTDLRSETTKKTIERYESNIEKLEEEIKKENKKLIKKVKDKAPIKYLLLFEEYCG